MDGLPHYLSDAPPEHAWRACTPLSSASGARAGRTAPTSTCPYLLGLPGGWRHLTFPEEPARGRPLEARGDRRLRRPRTAPLAWIDDAHDDTCHAWAEERPGPTLLVATDPAVGITDEHVDDAAQLGARSVRLTTSGGRRKRTGSPLVPTPEDT